MAARERMRGASVLLLGVFVVSILVVASYLAVLAWGRVSAWGITGRERTARELHRVLLWDRSGRVEDLRTASGPLRDAHRSWETCNPEWEAVYWDFARCEAFLRTWYGDLHLQAFRALMPYSFKCDFFRYCVVYARGGFYADWKQVCRRAGLLESLRDLDAVFFWDEGLAIGRRDRYVMTSFFGAKPGSPLLRSAIELVLHNVKTCNYGDGGLAPTGPACLGAAYSALPAHERFEISGTHRDGKYTLFSTQEDIITTKCEGCHEAGWPAGNDYAKMWDAREIYHKDACPDQALRGTPTQSLPPPAVQL